MSQPRVQADLDWDSLSGALRVGDVPLSGGVLDTVRVSVLIMPS